MASFLRDFLAEIFAAEESDELEDEELDESTLRFLRDLFFLAFPVEGSDELEKDNDLDFD